MCFCERVLATAWSRARKIARKWVVDALDLFKKTISLDQQDMGFLQKSASPAKALQARQVLISLAQKSSTHETQLSLIAAALRSKVLPRARRRVFHSILPRLASGKPGWIGRSCTFLAAADVERSGHTAEGIGREETVGLVPLASGCGFLIFL